MTTQPRAASKKGCTVTWKNAPPLRLDANNASVGGDGKQENAAAKRLRVNRDCQTELPSRDESAELDE
ncbi:hypothetical protein CKO51_26625 [Rhodopirellula sp. SM50]|nr:hypothetical protein CKO51_26625 [Rhodopirellula sp. SM50]